MRILIDECVNPRVREAFSGHNVVTVAEAGWRGLADHKLVALAQNQFDVLLTLDRGFEFEQNLSKLTLGIVMVHVSKNRIEYYRPIFAELLAAVEQVQPGEVIHAGERRGGRSEQTKERMN